MKTRSIIGGLAIAIAAAAAAVSSQSDTCSTGKTKRAERVAPAQSSARPAVCKINTCKKIGSTSAVVLLADTANPSCIMGCFSVLAYKAVAGDTANLPNCPSEISSGDWK